MSDKTAPLSFLASNASARPRMDTLYEWLSEPETLAKLQLCANAVVEAFQQDMTLRVPRDVALRKDGFAQWLRNWRVRLSPAIEAEFDKQFPGLAKLINPAIFDELVSGQVWPLIEPHLVQFAIRGLATSWIVRNLGDAVVMENSEWDGSQWIVSLRLRGHSQQIGSVVLDRDGNVITESSSTRQNVLAQING